MSQVTTYILDTTIGKPAVGVVIDLYQGGNDEWRQVARSVTNSEGCIPDLLPDELVLQQGIYKMRFETKDYFDRLQVKTFYPYVEIIFEIDSDDPYHIPLLLGPFGYSTFRGS